MVMLVAWCMRVSLEHCSPARKRAGWRRADRMRQYARATVDNIQYWLR